MRSDERGATGASAGPGELPRVRLAVLGGARVGKSALIVRYLTRRFIGEYHSNTDLLYRQTVSVGGAPAQLEVLDVSGGAADHFPAHQVEWADACLLVYAVTDRDSFRRAVELLAALRRAARTPTPLALLGTKTDLDHLRQVRRQEGEAAASAAGAGFGEASVAEADSSGELYRCVDRLLAECRRRASPPPHRLRKFSVSKMLGLISSAPTPAAPAPTSSGSSRSGSVVECPRAPAPAPASPAR